MADLATSRGTKIDADKLSELLDVPVVFTIGNKNTGIDSLLKAAIKLAGSKSKINARSNTATILKIPSQNFKASSKNV